MLPAYHRGVTTLRSAVLLFAGSTLVGLYFASQSMSNPTMVGRIDWRWALGVNLIYYWAWGLAVPVVIRAARAIPLEQGRLRTALLHHLLLSFIVTTVLIVVSEIALSPLREKPLLEVLPFSFAVNFHSSLPTYWLILAASTAYEYWRKYRDRETLAARLEARLSAARLDALRMQLNPHFLFNTLNSISSLMYDDREKADEMIARLGDFLRLTIDGESAPVNTLEREIEFARRYLEIEKIRFEERLVVEWDLDPETLPLPIPSFLLQPLIENAVHHGISTCEEGGVMRISAQRTADRLRITVANDRRGDAPSPHREGIGLRNTRERLSEMYGSHATLSASFAGQSACVTVDLPTGAKQ